MAIASRSETRKFLANLLRSTVQVEELLDHQDPQVSGKVTAVQLMSTGSFRRNFTRGFSDTTFRIGVVIFVLQFADDWTLEQGEDKLDEIDGQIAQAIADNQNTTMWRSLQWEGDSYVDRVILSGTPYLMEVIVLVVEAK